MLLSIILRLMLRATVSNTETQHNANTAQTHPQTHTKMKGLAVALTHGRSLASHHLLDRYPSRLSALQVINSGGRGRSCGLQTPAPSRIAAIDPESLYLLAGSDSIFNSQLAASTSNRSARVAAEGGREGGETAARRPG